MTTATGVRASVLRSVAAALVLVGLLVPVALAAGPPFPPPVEGQRVYDTDGLWSPTTIAQADQIIRRIEDRTGAQIAVYSQEVGYGVTGQDARDHAKALGTQWQVGRNGFNDGLVVLFDIDPSRAHGQVAIVAGDGFRAAYVDDAESQRIIDQEMIPELVGGQPDYDAALLNALRRIETEATPERAADLSRARVANAILGLIVAPIVGLLLIGWVAFSWLRFGRDPVYLDDPSILMPAPPDQLTAASGALVYDGSTSRRALTTALLDLASRGELAFEQRDGVLHKKVAIHTSGSPPVDDIDALRRRLNARRPLGDAERFALHGLRTTPHSGDVLEDDELLEFGKKVSDFDDKLEQDAVRNGWFVEAPGKVRNRWAGLGIVEIVIGVILGFVGVQVPISGLVVVGVAIGVAGVVTLIVAAWMPARTMAGATIRAMLAAYRRTLEKTMAQARSMQQVVDEAKLDWLQTPDQALVWGVALGLQSEVADVLQRSASDLQDGRAVPGNVWFPLWYGSSSSFQGGVSPTGGASLFSGSAVPDFGGMFGALGTVGNSPSSSGSGGGGGSFGGGGGFGGGASGGF